MINNKIIPREKYMNKIRPHMRKPVIKILTGIRRCGKSAMLTLIERELLAQGVNQNEITRINFEEARFAELLSSKALNRYLDEKIGNTKYAYILLDEIQEVESWEKVINSLFASGRADIYVTGSNSRLLSSELSTYLAGRYVEIEIQTLSFSEYLEFVDALKSERANATPESRYTSFMQYLSMGGFPLIHATNYDEMSAWVVINGIYSSVVLRDVIQRHSIRNTDLLNRLILFLMDNVGNIFSAKSISDFLKSEKREFSSRTIYEYLEMLEGAFVIRKVMRYDIAGKRLLQTYEKYYVSDISLIYASLDKRDTRISGILENIIYLELLSRDYKVTIGKLREKEIDFIAEKNGKKMYIQVSRSILSDETSAREFQPLLAIRDQYPKYVVTLDTVFGDNIDGVRHINIADFLMMDDY